MGPICSTFVHSQIHLIICAIFIPNRSTFPRLLNCWPPKPPAPKCRRGVSWGELFSLCPFPDESTDLYRIWCQSVHPFGSFPRLKFVTPKTPRNGPCGIEGWIAFSYVYSKTNPQTCTKWGANRSSRLAASLDFWMFDPLKPTKSPIVSLGANCLAYIHSQMNMHMCTKFGANRSSRFTSSPDFWICDPYPPPPNVEGQIVFSLCPFTDESADVYQIWCKSVQPFDSLPRRFDLWPPKTPEMPLCVSWGSICLAYIHSQINLHMWAKFGVNRSSRLVAFPECMLS